MCVLAALSCLTLCNPTDCSPPGSSVHGILQARILELGAVPTPRGSSQHQAPTLTSPALAGGFFTSTVPFPYTLLVHVLVPLHPAIVMASLIKTLPPITSLNNSN